jgi:dTDP-4-dehydrorhamnose reductase
MKKSVQVSIVHDNFGNIVSINRLAKDVKAIVSSGNGQSVLITSVDENSISGLINTHRVDIINNLLVKQ